MRIVTTMIILGGMLTACGTNGPEAETNDDRVAALEKSVYGIQGDIALLAGNDASIQRQIALIDDKLDTLIGAPWLPDLTGPEGPRGPRGFRGYPGEDGEDGEDGRNGIDGWPRNKADMVVVPGTTAKVAGFVDVESYCPTARDIAVSGSCRFISPPEACDGVALKAWGTFDNDTPSVAGFGCTFGASEATACEVLAVADCIRLP